MLEDGKLIESMCDEFSPEVLVHLAAQAGVRYSLTNPRAYIDSNVVGSLNILEAARRLKVKHLLMASTSSVYGSNLMMPFRESDKSDSRQFTLLLKRQMKAWLILMRISIDYN